MISPIWSMARGPRDGNPSIFQIYLTSWLRKSSFENAAKHTHIL